MVGGIDAMRAGSSAGMTAPTYRSRSPAKDALFRHGLKTRVTRVMLSLGQGLEQAGKAEAAIELYRRALELDNLAEELYRLVITCHGKLGQPAEAMATYRRCRELPSVVLGIQPSAESEQLFRALQAA